MKIKMISVLCFFFFSCACISAGGRNDLPAEDFSAPAGAVYPGYENIRKVSESIGADLSDRTLFEDFKSSPTVSVSIVGSGDGASADIAMEIQKALLDRGCVKVLSPSLRENLPELYLVGRITYSPEKSSYVLGMSLVNPYAKKNIWRRDYALPDINMQEAGVAALKRPAEKFSGARARSVLSKLAENCFSSERMRARLRNGKPSVIAGGLNNLSGVAADDKAVLALLVKILSAGRKVYLVGMDDAAPADISAEITITSWTAAAPAGKSPKVYYNMWLTLYEIKTEDILWSDRYLFEAV